MGITGPNRGCGPSRRSPPAAAGAAAGWARRLTAHPVIAAALAAGQLSTSWARQICDGTDQLPENLRGDADRILLAAALGGADLHDLNALAREMIERSRTSAGPDEDGFADRALWLQTTIGGAGRLLGDLTPECAARLQMILDTLGAKGGPEDTRSAAQRRHDALNEACTRLAGAGMETGGDHQPAAIGVHIDLAALRGLPGATGAETGWTLARAAAGPGSVYLSGAAAEAATCDAVLTPIVSGHIDEAILDQLTHLILHANGHDPGQQDGGQAAAGRGGEPAGGPGGSGAPGGSSGQTLTGRRLPGLPERPGQLSPATRQRLRDTLLNMSISLLSGPGGLAACLRTTTLGQPYTARSQPLDVGRSTRTVPPYLRKAVIQRDQHCQFPGCTQPPARCDAHHLIHWSKGGPTSLGNLRLLCTFHHLIVIHRWGWELTCHPDGTTTATSPDGRILHSHGPPGKTA